MAGLTSDRLKAVRDQFAPGPRIFCETGTFRGDRAALATEHFPEVHTVELSPALWTIARELHGALPITFECGDSRAWVPRWAATFAEPVCWYLDAHWFDLNRTKTRDGAARAAANPVAGQEAPFPLWDELRVLALRPYQDIIIVDDIHDFGSDRTCPEWGTATVQQVYDYFPGARHAGVIKDQAVVWR